MNTNRCIQLCVLPICCLYLLVGPGCIRRVSEIQEFENVFQGASALEVSNMAGRITIGGTDNDDMLVKTRIRVETYSIFGHANPDNYFDEVMTTEEMDATGGVVRLRANVTSRVFGATVIALVYRDVVAPSSIPVDIENNAGDVSVVDMAGDVAVTLNAGNLSLTSVGGDVEATVNAGKATLQDIAGDVSCRVNAGNLMLEDVRGVVEARVNAGNLEFNAITSTFSDQEYRVDAGNVVITLPGDASFAYDLKTTVGDIKPTGIDMNVTVVNVTGKEARGTHNDNPQAAIDATVNAGNIHVTLD